MVGGGEGVDSVEECEGLRRQATARLAKVASEGGSSAAVRGVDEKAALLLPSTDGRLRDCGGVECLGRGCCAFGSASPEREMLHMLAVVALYYTHIWASCQGLIPVWSACLSVLLRRFLWHAGSQKIICCVVQHTDKTNTNPLRLVDSLSHTRTKARPLHLNQPGAPGLPLVAEACLNLRSRLAATAAGQVPRIDDSPSDDPGCFTSKVKRSYPGPWLANAASPIIR